MPGGSRGPISNSGNLRLSPDDPREKCRKKSGKNSKLTKIGQFEPTSHPGGIIAFKGAPQEGVDRFSRSATQLRTTEENAASLLHDHPVHLQSAVRGARAVNNVTKFRGKTTNRADANASNSEITKRIYLLGVMQAIGPVGENILPRAKKTQAVLAYLCLRRGERLRRGRVAGIIWDRSGEAQARESLRHALNDLNRTGHWRLEKDHDAVRLDVTGCWIDAFEIPEHSELLLESLYGISPSFDQWLVGERIQLEHRWQTRLEKELNGLVAEAAAPELRAAAARKLLNVVPTHEGAVRNLMSAFVDLDDHAQAIREYERFQGVVSTSLGMPPSEKTTALHEAIRLESRVRATRAARRTEHKAWNAGEFSGEKDDLAGKETSGADTAQQVQPSIADLPF